jgi:hypothetical protein
VSRKDDLERHVRESYEIIRQYEEIDRTSDRPQEKARARREIEEQWALVKGHLATYQILCQRLGKPLAEDILEIAVTLDAKTAPADESLDRATWGEVSPDDPGPDDEGLRGRKEALLRVELKEAREHLLLIRERKTKYVMETDIPLQLIREERHLQQRIAKLEQLVTGLGG